MEDKMYVGQVVYSILYKGANSVEALGCYNFLSDKKHSGEPMNLMGTPYYIQVLEVMNISGDNFNENTVNYEVSIKGIVVNKIKPEKEVNTIELLLLKGQYVSFELCDGKNYNETKRFYQLMIKAKENKETVKLSGSDYNIQVLDCNVVTNEKPFNLGSTYDIQIKGVIV